MIIPPGWNLPNAINERLGQKTYGRQRAIFEDGHLLLILHKPPMADETTREGVLFWRNPEGEWKWSRGNNGGQALAAHVQSYIDREAALMAGCDKANDAKTLYGLLGEVTPLARAARNMHSALQAAREAVTEKLIIEQRDRASEAERNLDLLLEDLRNMIQYRTIREAEEQSRLSAEALRSSHRLNVLAAIFLPLTAITGVFGMNMAAGIDQTKASYFWAITGFSVALGLALKVWVLGAAGKETPTPKSPPVIEPKAKT